MSRAYWEAFASSARRSWRSPGGIVVSCLFYTLILLVFAALWHAATTNAGHAATDTGGTVGGYNYKQLLWYMMATEAAVISVPARRIERIGDDIANGTVETELLRPVSVFGLRLATEMGEALTQLAASFLVGSAVTIAFVGLPANPLGALLAIPALILAVANNFIAVHAFAAIAFWVRDAKATWFLFQKLIFLPGGMLLPLELLPHWLQTVSWALPFWTMAYAPGRLMTGHIEPLLIVGQVAWTISLLIGANALFAVGERRLLAGR